MKHCRKAAGEFTRKSSAAESANFRATGVPDAGKKKICRVSCVDLHLYVQRVSVIGVPDGLSDGEGVVASRREINFARQFFRISLFIFGVQQDFRDPLAERLRSEIALNSPPMTNGNTARLFGDDYRNGVRFLGDSEPGAMT